MNTSPHLTRRLLVLAALLALAQGCGGGGEEPRAAAERETADGSGALRPLPNHGPNMVSRWDVLAAQTYNTPTAQAGGTPAEQRPLWPVDYATVHVAMYDAAMAIARTHRPFAVKPRGHARGASIDAAVMAAAHGVLQGLFPSRSAVYQPAYDAMLAQMPDNEARRRGLAIGREVAAGVLALRADDGRLVALGPFVPGTEPGKFRGANPIGRFYPAMKPFAIRSATQFRAPGPPALTSGTYAAELEEVRRFGRTDSAERSAEQTEVARSHTELPNVYWPRNFNQFLTSQPTLAANARLGAMIWVSMADTLLGCFESKYHHLYWRPASAITLADTDGNDATLADPAWTPLGPVPNHPEYPAAHTCIAGAMSEVLTDAFGRRKLIFSFSSQVTGSTHTYTSIQAMADELFDARIWGGMHFRTSLVDGAVLGKRTTRYVLRHHFEPHDR